MGAAVFGHSYVHTQMTAVWTQTLFFICPVLDNNLTHVAYSCVYTYYPFMWLDRPLVLYTLLC